MASHVAKEEGEGSESAVGSVSPELINRVRALTGLVHLDGLIFWPQHQLLRSLPDPLAKKLVTIIESMPADTRTWKKILKKLQDEEKK